MTMAAAPMARAGLALLLASASVAWPADEPKKKPGRHHVGPLYVTPRLLLKDAGVDTNVFHTLNDPTKDAVVVLSPRVDGDLTAGRLHANGYGLVEFNYFRREDDQRATDFYGEGHADLDLGPLVLFGGGGGGQFTQRFSIDVDDRLERQEKRAIVGANLHLGRRLTATGQATTEVYTFAPGTFRLGGNVKEAMDRNTLTASGQLRYALTNRTTLLVSADVLEDRFFSDPSPASQERRSYRYLGGVELGSRALVTGRLLAGVRDFPAGVDQGSPPYRGPVVAADLALPVGRARLRAFGERDVLYASSLVDVGTVRYRNAFVLGRFGGEVLFGLPAGFSGLAGAAFEQASYLWPYPYPNNHVFSDRVDHRYTATLGLNKQLNDQIRIGGYLGFARRVSSLPLFSYEGMRYGVNAEIVP
jgi:hypothetical protein